MSFTDQKPRIATPEDCKANWNGGKLGKRFRCYLCGHKFIVGDVWRFVSGNSGGQALGNFLVCEECDGHDVLDRYKAAIAEARERFWWLYATIEDWQDEAHRAEKDYDTNRHF